MKQHCTATLVALAALACAAAAGAQPRPVFGPRPMGPAPMRPFTPSPVIRSQPAAPVYVSPPRVEPVRPYYPPPRPAPVSVQPVYNQPGPPRPQPVYVQPGYAGPPRPQPVYNQPGYASPPRPVYAPPPPRPIAVAPMPVRPLPVATPIRVRVAPPPMRVEMVTRSPGPGYFWVAGHWHWDGYQYVWVPGHWDMPPSPQAVWVPSRWDLTNGYYEYSPGRWQYGNGYPAGYAQQPMTSSLQLNTRVDGYLQQGDQILQHGAYGDDYAVDLPAGQTVTLIANGGPSYTRPGRNLDVLMQVLFNGAVVAQDDDSAGNLDARIDFVPQVPGTYVVRVTTYNGGYEQGAYSLQSWVQQPQPQPVAVEVQPQPVQPVAQVQPQPQSAAAVQVGGAFSGALEQGDAQFSDGSVADEYPINLVAGQPVTIVVRGGPVSDGSGGSLDVVATLLLDNQAVAQDDDGAGYPNARVVYTPQQSGQYTLRVSAFGAGFHGGSYTVQTWSGAYENAQ